ncbi:hypothetical protein GCM10009730_51580 [Streptomyces albidochromogenes]
MKPAKDPPGWGGAGGSVVADWCQPGQPCQVVSGQDGSAVSLSPVPTAGALFGFGVVGCGVFTT